MEENMGSDYYVLYSCPQCGYRKTHGYTHKLDSGDDSYWSCSNVDIAKKVHKESDCKKCGHVGYENCGQIMSKEKAETWVNEKQ